MIVSDCETRTNSKEEELVRRIYQGKFDLLIGKKFFLMLKFNNIHVETNDFNGNITRDYYLDVYTILNRIKF